MIFRNVLSLLCLMAMQSIGFTSSIICPTSLADCQDKYRDNTSCAKYFTDKSKDAYQNGVLIDPQMPNSIGMASYIKCTYPNKASDWLIY